MEFLKGLKPEATDREVGLYHASPRDPVWEYVLAVDQARECMEEQSGAGQPDRPLARGPLLLRRRRRTATGGQAPEGHEIDLSEGRWLLNPGSVGQPRDGDPRAAWLELDTDQWKATYHRVEYDIERAADAIREAGLPDLLADRLSVGQ